MRFEILQYKTGWDYKISHGDLSDRSVIHIQAHAPSSLVLKCLESGTLKVVARILPGGNSRATPSIQTREVKYNEPYQIDCLIDGFVNLSCETDDKTANWNYWSIYDGEIVPHIENAYTAVKHSHLGDAIGIAVGLNNIAIKNDVFINVSGEIFKDLLGQFQFGRLKYIDESSAYNVDDLYGASSWEESWLSRFSTVFANRIGSPVLTDILIPKCNKTVNPGNTVLCQFDSRSAAVPGGLDLLGVIQILSKGSQVAAIGGNDTKRYLGDFEYRLGNLEFIVDQLARCKYFIGCDSGIAHLAGIMGVKAYIINFISFDTVYKMFSCYKNMTIIDRKLFEA